MGKRGREKNIEKNGRSKRIVKQQLIILVGIFGISLTATPLVFAQFVTHAIATHNTFSTASVFPTLTPTITPTKTPTPTPTNAPRPTATPTSSSSCGGNNNINVSGNGAGSNN